MRIGEGAGEETTCAAPGEYSVEAVTWACKRERDGPASEVPAITEYTVESGREILKRIRVSSFTKLAIRPLLFHFVMLHLPSLAHTLIPSSSFLQLIFALVALAATHAVLIEMGWWRTKLDVRGKVGLFPHIAVAVALAAAMWGFQRLHVSTAT